jgi:tyrosyl-tRNA synthetase
VDHLDGSSLNCAKSILAFEATLIAHGREEALNAYKTASSVFGTRSISEKILPSSTIPREHVAVEDISVPQTLIHKQQARDGIPMVDLFFLAGLVKSKGAARRLINQGGAYLNNERVKAIDTVVTMADFRNDEIMLRSGKKHYHKISIKS